MYEAVILAIMTLVAGLSGMGIVMVWREQHSSKSAN